MEIERKYKTFTDNIKITLKKAIERDNYTLAENINNYLDYMDELKLSKKYNYNVEEIEGKIDRLQKEIIRNQFEQKIYNINTIAINIPKYEKKEINYIMLFIYKYVKINGDLLCLISKNIIEQLFSSNTITTTDNMCEILQRNVNIVYNKKLNKIELKTDNSLVSANINKIISKLNKYDINKNMKKYNLEFTQKTQEDFKILLVVIIFNIFNRINCKSKKIRSEIDELTTERKKILKETYSHKVKEKSRDILEKIKKLNVKESLSKEDLQKEICNYIKLNTKYEINKEYDMLHNYILSRSLSEIELFKTNKEHETEIMIPKVNLNFMNVLILSIYNFMSSNKDDICRNILKLLNHIRDKINKRFDSIYINGRKYYDEDKIISLCSNDVNAKNLIHTFYSKYSYFDKVLISKMFKNIIEQNGLKIKYNRITDKFTAQLINLDKIDIDFKKMDKMDEKFVEGLNKDLECLNTYINKNIIKKIFETIVDIINIILETISDKKLVNNILGIKSKEFGKIMNNKKNNYETRKLCVIIFIKFILTTIADYHINPLNVGKPLFEDIINEIHKILCKKMKTIFNYDTLKMNETIYNEFPTYKIN